MISVVIPALNEERLLPALLDQFTPERIERYDLEIIVSDGGSGDSTCDIVRERGFSLVHAENLGNQTIGEGRNLGAAQARGDIFVFLNADIRISDPDAFFRQVQAMTARPDIVAATCDVQVFPEDERTGDRVFHVLHNRYVRLLNVIGEGMGRGECQVMPRAIFEKVGGYNPAMAAGEDYDLYRRIRRLGKIAMLTGITVYESPRRFRKYGYLRIIIQWTMNALSVAWRKTSSSRTWDAVR